jgi:hypothetical protein
LPLAPESLLLSARFARPASWFSDSMNSNHNPNKRCELHKN